MKKIVSIFMVFIMCFMVTNVAFAAIYPSNSVMNGYKTALDNNDYANIVNYGSKIIDFYKDKQDTDKVKLDVITPRLSVMAKAYEKLNQLDKAKETWKSFAFYADLQGWKDSVREGEYRQRIIEGSQLKVFTTSSKPTYFGAKNEPKSGIYYGKPNGTYAEFKPNKANSLISTYCTYGKDDLLFPDELTDKMLQVNWNIPEDNYGIISQIPSQTSTIEAMAKKLSDYGKPVLLRFGAEMNVWNPTPDATTFKNAFIAVSKIMKEKAPNVAMVWAPSDVPPFYVNTHDFYPGDNYVDWVGISAYTNKNFLGRSDHNDYTNATFLSGPYADPITRLEDIIGTYGDRKPIIITESGIGHYSTVTGEDLTAFASENLRQLYTYLPMIYPQVKAIIHFDVRLASSKTYYDLSGNPELQKVYNEVIASNSYLTGISKTSDIAYEPLTDRSAKGILDIYAYAAFNTTTTQKIGFYIDGKMVHETIHMPYKYSLDTSKYSKGVHKVEIRVIDGSQLIDSKTFNITITE